MRFVGVRDGRRVLIGCLLDATAGDGGGGGGGSAGTGGGAGGRYRVARLAEVDEFYADLPRWTAAAREITAASRRRAEHEGAGEDAGAGKAGAAVGVVAGAAVGAGAGAAAEITEITEIDLLPPVPAGARILGMGLNYHAHAAETGLELPKKPPIFARWTASLAVEGTPVPVPPGERGLDWEGELAAVVGARLTDVDEETALAGVFGYAAFNDLSARRAQGASAQWTLGKNADRSGPMSPVVTADEVGDPGLGLRLVTRVNGEV
ncbi:fumarylacetoacetate hydrolase family protein, partial [Frankia sp. EI5c]|uniref:fumarylacetoacetate hydrolase family protein n=1 Tax=Frankia sp. EI5c TaxID=683316 RepID=UPI0037BEFE3C